MHGESEEESWREKAKAPQHPNSGGGTSRPPPPTSPHTPGATTERCVPPRPRDFVGRSLKEWGRRGVDAARENSFRVLRCTTAPFLKIRRDSMYAVCARATTKIYSSRHRAPPLSRRRVKHRIREGAALNPGASREEHRVQAVHDVDPVSQVGRAKAPHAHLAIELRAP